jgi:hypothetical protein
MTTETKTYLYFLKIASIPALLLVLIILLIRNDRENHIRTNQEKEISKIINNTIEEYSKKNLLLPKLVFINTDSLTDKQLKDTLKKQIVNLLTQQYLKDDTVQFSNLELQPFFISSASQDIKNKKFSFTQEMYDNLIKHIEFLTKQVDVEVTRTKEEVDRDINRLNTWVTLWVALIGFLGIFFPLFVNYEIKSTADKALANANQALSSIENISAKMDDAENKVKNAASLAEKTAHKTEKLMLATNAIGNLRSLDEHTIKVISDPKKALIISLESIHKELLDCNDQFFSHKIIRDCLRQLAVKLHLLSLNDTFQEYMHQMNEMSVQISEALKVEMTKEKFEALLSKLNDLITALKAE